jgi:hypothetical protein
MSRSCCTNPQPGGPGKVWSRFSSSSPWYASIKLQGSSPSYDPPRVFYFPGTLHIWWAFPYPPPGEAPGGSIRYISGYRSNFTACVQNVVVVQLLLLRKNETKFGESNILWIRSIVTQNVFTSCVDKRRFASQKRRYTWNVKKKSDAFGESVLKV